MLSKSELDRRAAEFEKKVYTAESYTAVFGEPVQDDLERANCK
jgi:hypothetical protein